MRAGRSASGTLSRSSGIEQGFTIPRAPARTPTGPLTIALGLQGPLRASMARGDTVSFSRGGSTVLRYGGLSAVDATGRHLPAWLGLQNGDLLVRVDVHGSAVPREHRPVLRAEAVQRIG